MMTSALAALLLGGLTAWAAPPSPPLLTGGLHWSAGPPLAGPLDRDGDHFYSIKDPSFVQVRDRWHLFCTVRGKNRPQQIEYLTFQNWNAVGKGERHMLPITDDYFCAPTVFYFTPQKKWYLIYQYSAGSKVERRRVPAFSTNADVGDWQHWTKPALLYPADSTPSQTFGGSWIDFWVICDKHKAFLFFTRDNGQMWRAETTLAAFPHGWSAPVLAIQGDVFEASHTYAVRGTSKYLTIIEAIHAGRRYYQGYEADALDGAWRPAGATWNAPFAGKTNVTEAAGHWTDSFSHGELFRANVDQTMEVAPAGLKMLFQGVADEDMRGKPYGEIPWRLGILSPSPGTAGKP